MLLTKDQTAPVTGFYKVLDSSETLIGTVYVEVGGKMPPAMSPLNHYEIEISPEHLRAAEEFGRPIEQNGQNLYDSPL